MFYPPGFLDLKTQKAFVEEVERVGQDPIYWVRREATFALGALSKVVPEELVMCSLVQCSYLVMLLIPLICLLSSLYLTNCDMTHLGMSVIHRCLHCQPFFLGCRGNNDVP